MGGGLLPCSRGIPLIGGSVDELAPSRAMPAAPMGLSVGELILLRASPQAIVLPAYSEKKKNN